MGSDDTLEARLRRLEDHAAIVDLKAAYCNAADGGWDRPSHDADAVAELFVDDGLWDGATFGRAEGRDAIRDLFSGFRRHPLAFHAVTNPIITVDGDHAAGQWHVVVAMTLDGDRPYLLGGIYDDEFARTEVGWRFRSLVVTPSFAHRLAGPWRIP